MIGVSLVACTLGVGVVDIGLSMINSVNDCRVIFSGVGNAALIIGLGSCGGAVVSSKVTCFFFMVAFDRLLRILSIFSKIQFVLFHSGSSFLSGCVSGC